MKSYSLKSLGNKNDYMTILSEQENGFVIRIVRDQDGYEDIKTDFLSKELFESCIRTGYLTEIEVRAFAVYGRGSFPGGHAVQASGSKLVFARDESGKIHFFLNKLNGCVYPCFFVRNRRKPVYFHSVFFHKSEPGFLTLCELPDCNKKLLKQLFPGNFSLKKKRAKPVFKAKLFKAFH